MAVRHAPVPSSRAEGRPEGLLEIIPETFHGSTWVPLLRVWATTRRSGCFEGAERQIRRWSLAHRPRSVRLRFTATFEGDVHGSGALSPEPAKSAPHAQLQSGGRVPQPSQFMKVDQQTSTLMARSPKRLAPRPSAKPELVLWRRCQCPRSLINIAIRVANDSRNRYRQVHLR